MKPVTEFDERDLIAGERAYEAYCFQMGPKYQNGELRPTFQDLHSSVQYGWAAAAVAVQKRYGAIY